MLVGQFVLIGKDPNQVLDFVSIQVKREHVVLELAQLSKHNISDHTVSLRLIIILLLFQLLLNAIVDGSFPEDEIMPYRVLGYPILKVLPLLRLKVFNVESIGKDQDLHCTEGVHILLGFVQYI